MKAYTLLLMLLIFSCVSSGEKELRKQIAEKNTTFLSNNINLPQQLLSAPEAIKEQVYPLIKNAQSAGDIAIKLIDHPGNLTSRQLLDSLLSLEDLQAYYWKKATEIEIEYNNK